MGTMHHPTFTGPRRRAVCAVLAALALVLSAVAARAACGGDCDGDSVVRIDELVTAVAIALGDPVGRCRAADSNGDGAVSIDELIAAVGAALNGCGSEPDTGALRASTSVAAAPLVTVLDFGTVGAGGGGGAGGRARAAAGPARPATVSGCTTTDCFLYGFFTGTETVCCYGAEYSLTDDSCTFDTADGTVIGRNGTFVLDSPTADVCSGVIPVGESFTARFQALATSVEDPSGGFVSTNEDFTETFVARQAGCGTTQPDEFGFAVRGDGVRQLSGTRHVLAGDGYSLVADLESRTDGLTIAVDSQESGSACGVAAAIGGAIEVIDGLTGSDVVTTYDQFGVGELRDGNDLLLLYEGTIGTDCLGQVSIDTISPVRLRPDEPCPIGGVVQLELAAGRVAVTYTATGGVELDFGADQSVDERVDRCEQLTVEQCGFQPPSGVCAVCAAGQSCGEGLQCYSCSLACAPSAPLRCSFPDDFVFCEDGVY